MKPPEEVAAELKGARSDDDETMRAVSSEVSLTPAKKVSKKRTTKHGAKTRQSKPTPKAEDATRSSQQGEKALEAIREQEPLDAKEERRPFNFVSGGRRLSLQLRGTQEAELETIG